MPTVPIHTLRYILFYNRSFVGYGDMLYYNSRVNYLPHELELPAHCDLRFVNLPHLLHNHTMTRPRLHWTPEEKTEAARRSRKKYYDR